ncbi:serine hydrolase domain-containing protein [Sphingosinicella sp. LHD-64]|uniref:serine hydrolase domain-containing protein n=1 Tax=Sphingosinicella sp. LHD-64 TaxID=3072139 RepID=UPI002810112A|nr:serine hydrolase domain-containing protein [Sphingosinicella sp. LHD-64]MDQ8755773.1 serine hydrolase domain-containing protein [Sphingosinicella sp. LHD-64]
MLHRLARAKLAAAALMLLVLLPSPGRAQATPSLAQVIDSFAGEHEFSGTILLRARGRTLYARSFGLADRAFDIPAAADTRFRIASITKLFTAVLALQLVEDGRLRLDAPIRTYLPDYPGQGADRVTVHHLLNHTSGLVQYDRISSYQEGFANGIEQYQRPLSPAAMLQRCCSGPLARAPGTAFDYNNADYIVLGRIIERIADRPFEAVLAERILRPLGLDGTGMSHWDRIVPRLAPTYFFRDDTRRLVPDMPVYFENWDAAGGMYSTAADLADFADALYGGRLIGRDMLARMLMPGLDDYGYGLWSYTITRGGRPHRVAKRPGSVMGANAVLYRLLDRDATVVLLANTNRADLDVFAQRIGDVFVR